MQLIRYERYVSPYRKLEQFKRLFDGGYVLDYVSRFFCWCNDNYIRPDLTEELTNELKEYVGQRCEKG